MSKIRLISAVLTQDAKRTLSILTEARPFFKKVYFHHCTLAFNPTEEMVSEIEKVVKENDEILIKCHHCVLAKGVQFISCLPYVNCGHMGNINVPCFNKGAHITISTDGRPPKDSNVILETPLYELLKDPNTVITNFNGTTTVSAIIKYER